MDKSFPDQLRASAAAMSRRQQNTTDACRVSVVTSLAEAIHENAKLLEKLSVGSPEDILNRAFSTNSALSTACTFAMEQQAASADRELQLHRQIGYGRCGYVFELIGTGEVAKVAVSDDGIELYVDCYMHQKILESFQKVMQQIPLCHIPTPREYIAPTSLKWWEVRGPRFPEEHRKLRGVLISERILPLPKIVRHALIDKYCPQQYREAAIANPINRDCLVRVYLGELRNNRPYMNFNLRNFQLCLDQIPDLELSADDFASTIANTLAVIHFHAELDARDVEFVLGTAPSFSHSQLPPAAELLRGSPNSGTAPIGTGINSGKRWIHLWVLDFNECGPITMDEEGMEIAADAFYQNAPYCPRPPKAGIMSNAQMDYLWAVFRQSYLKSSGIVLKGRSMDPEKLPRTFMDKLEESRPY